jgi:16S rRNA (guanine527-N7)-methyltransferase
LPLENVKVLNERAETLGQDRDHREQYDTVVTRAVGPLPVALELTVPLVRNAGHVLSIKGRRAEQEVKEAAEALKLLHCEVVEVTETPTGTIVAVQKERRTPKLYPRRPGEPKRVPLGRRPKT